MECTELAWASALSKTEANGFGNILSLNTATGFEDVDYGNWDDGTDTVKRLVCAH